jgi:hypothetical protein
MIPEKDRPELKKTKRRLTVADAGIEMRTDGIAELTITIGKVSFNWPVYIAPIRDDILFGCDIIDKKCITVNTRKGIKIYGEWLNCVVTRIIDNTAKVKISRSFTIPANSQY